MATIGNRISTDKIPINVNWKIPLQISILHAIQDTKESEN